MDEAKLKDSIDNSLIVIGGKKYRDLLKYKEGQQKPRGYPDAFLMEKLGTLRHRR